MLTFNLFQLVKTLNSSDYLRTSLHCRYRTRRRLTGRVDIWPRGLLTAYGILAWGRLTGVANDRGVWPGVVWPGGVWLFHFHSFHLRQGPNVTLSSLSFSVSFTASRQSYGVDSSHGFTHSSFLQHGDEVQWFCLHRLLFAANPETSDRGDASVPLSAIRPVNTNSSNFSFSQDVPSKSYLSGSNCEDKFYGNTSEW